MAGQWLELLGPPHRRETLYGMARDDGSDAASKVLGKMPKHVWGCSRKD
jgi:hypothetical protein